MRGTRFGLQGTGDNMSAFGTRRKATGTREDDRVVHRAELKKELLETSYTLDCGFMVSLRDISFLIDPPQTDPKSKIRNLKSQIFNIYL
jgi:hypothetical protein